MAITRMPSVTASIMRLRLPLPLAGATSWVSVFILFCSPAALGLRQLRHEPAAEGLNQVNRQIEAAGLQLCLEAALDQQLRFGAQYLQVIAHALPIAQYRQIVGLPGARQGLALFATLLPQTVHGGEGIDHFAQGIGHDLVVLFHSNVI